MIVATSSVGERMKSPTQKSLLFQLIQNRKFLQAISRVQSSPEESQVWNQDINEEYHGDHHEETLGWRYLPLHFMCLSIQHYNIHRTIQQQVRQDRKYNQMKQLISLLVQSYSKAIRSKDSHGNLPIHYLLQQQQQQHPQYKTNTNMNSFLYDNYQHRPHSNSSVMFFFDGELLNILMDSKLSNLKSKDGQGRTISDLIHKMAVMMENRNHVANDYHVETPLHVREFHSWLRRLLDIQHQVVLSQEEQSKMMIQYDYNHDPHHPHHPHHPRKLHQLEQKYKKLKKYSSSVERECLSKDEIIDDLSAQLYTVKAKLVEYNNQAQNNQHHVHRHRHEETETKSQPLSSTATIIAETTPLQTATTTTPTFQTVWNENQKLKETLVLDTTIVSHQEEEITKLLNQIKILEDETAHFRKEDLYEKQKKIDNYHEIKSNLQSNNNAIVHLRKVINVLQNEIEAKCDEVAILQKKLNESKSEHQLLQQEILNEKKNKEKVGCNVVEMNHELKEQSETISRLVQSLAESRIFCDIQRQREEIKQEEKQGEEKKIDTRDDVHDDGNNFEGVQNHNMRSPIRVYTNEDDENDKKVDIFERIQRRRSSSSSHSDTNTTTVTATTDLELLKDRQRQLRHNLKDLYNEIKSAQRLSASDRYTLPPFSPVMMRTRNERIESRPWRQQQQKKIINRMTAPELGKMILEFPDGDESQMEDNEDDRIENDENGDVNDNDNDNDNDDDNDNNNDNDDDNDNDNDRNAKSTVYSI